MRFRPLLNNLLAIGAGLILLILCDAGLALFGIEPLSREDRFAGFSASQPIFLETEPGRFDLNPAKARYFNTPQSFTMPKPAGVFRVVVFGGSTTYGRPYLRHTSFGAWFEQLVERYAPGREIEVINLGGISYASYRVRRLVEEMADYDPDLYLLYSGHNEFLEARTFADLREEPPWLSELRGLAHHSRIYSSLARLLGKTGGAGPGGGLGEEVEATLEQVGGPELYRRDPAFRAGVIRQYRDEISRMAEFCSQQEIPLVLATLPVNLADMSPFKSEHRAGLTEAEFGAWNVAYREGLKMLAQGAFAGALDSFQQAAEIDDRYAQLHYLIGRAALGVGDPGGAYEAFNRARQEDIVPLRALDEFNRIIKEIAEQRGVPLADVEGFFRRVSPGHIPGNNLFADHVHPTIEGQQLVAWVFLNAATDAGLVPLPAARWQQAMPEARAFLRAQLDQVSDRYLAMGLWGVGRLFFWAGKYPEAYAALQRAWEMVRDIPEIPVQLAKLELLRGRAVAALDYLDAAAELNADDPQSLSTRAAALIDLQRTEEAAELLDSLQQPGGQGDNPELVFLRGRLLLAQGRPGEAVKDFSTAVQLAPGVATFRLTLAEALRESGRHDAALREYAAYLAQRGDASGELSPQEWIKER